MYREHVGQIVDYVGRNGAPALQDVCVFALLSIRQRFDRIKAAMADVRRHGVESKALWGWKLQGYETITENSDELFRSISGNSDTISVVEAIFDRTYGLGSVKAGFVAQMLGYNVACFDSRNMEELGFLPTDTPWRLNHSAKPATKRRTIARYVRATQAKGAEFWWNDWCLRQGRQYGYPAETISRWHVDAIIGE